MKGRDLFDASLFKDPASTALFYTFMGELKDIVSKASLTPTHHFLANLNNRNQLLRCYTQNIDCLEARLNLPCDLNDKRGARIVQLHGDLDHVICTFCKALFEFNNTWSEIFKKGKCPPCPACVDLDNIRTASGKRPLSIGTLRPNIVLYNEFHHKGKRN